MKEQKFLKIIDDIKSLTPEEFKKYNNLGNKLRVLGVDLIKEKAGVEFLLKMLKSSDDYYVFYSATQLFSVNKKEAVEAMKYIATKKNDLGTHAILTLAGLD